MAPLGSSTALLAATDLCHWGKSQVAGPAGSFGAMVMAGMAAGRRVPRPCHMAKLPVLDFHTA